MNNIIYTLGAILSVGYLVMTVVYANYFFSAHRHEGRLLRFALPVLLSLHLVKLILHGIAGKQCPVMGIYAAFSFIAFSLALIYFIVERYQKYYSTGSIFLAIVFVFQSVSLISQTQVSEVSGVLAGVPFGIHAPMALLGVAALSTSAIYGFIYLILSQMLKSRWFTANMKRMPSLETIEKMLSLSGLMAFVFIVIAYLAGLFVGESYNVGFNLMDMKTVVTVIILHLLGYGVVGAYFFRHSGRKRAIVALLAFLAAILSMTVGRFIFPTFHNF